MNRVSLLKASSALTVVGYLAFSTIAGAVSEIDFSTPTRSILERSSLRDSILEPSSVESSFDSLDFRQKKDKSVAEIIKAAEIAYALSTNTQTETQKRLQEEKRIYDTEHKKLIQDIRSTGLNLDAHAPDIAQQVLNTLKNDSFMSRFVKSETQQEASKLAEELVNMSAAVYEADSTNLKAVLASRKDLNEELKKYNKIDSIKDDWDTLLKARETMNSASIENIKNAKKIKNIEKIREGYFILLKQYAKVKDDDIFERAKNDRNQERFLFENAINNLEQEIKTAYLSQKLLYRQEVEAMISRNVNTAGTIDKVVHVFTRNNGEFSGYVGYSSKENRLYVCFAGSKTRNDWIKNFQAWNGGTQAASGLLQGLVFHSGFAKIFNEAAPEFIESMTQFFKDNEEVLKNKGLEICGTGHSLGGALAEMFTAATNEMVKKHIPNIKTKISVVTVGTPNNIAKAVSGTYDEKFNGAGNVIHFAHKYDPVPSLAFWRSNNAVARVQDGMDSLLYNHHKMFIWLNINPHSSEGYSHAISQAIKEWKKKLIPLQESAQSFLEKQDAFEKIKTLIDQETAEIESYKNRLENLLGAKRVNMNNSIYDIHAGTLSNAIGEATSIVALNKNDVMNNIAYFEQEKKTLQKELREISEQLKSIENEKDLARKKARNEGRLFREEHYIKHQKNLEGKVKALKETLDYYEEKLQKLAPHIPKLDKMLEILKEAEEGKFRFNKPRSWFGRILGY